MTLIHQLLDSAFITRQDFIDNDHNSAYRLFNGFVDGFPELCLDVYGSTILIHDYSEHPEIDLSATARNWILEKLPWVKNIVLKLRNGSTATEKRGFLIHGESPDRKILENNTWYAINLLLNRDASFYLDTRNLRVWLKRNLSGKTVLNTFAYTGSLGIAALSGGANRVVQLDRNENFLNLAKKSTELNHINISSKDFVAKDIFEAVSQYKKNSQFFDCVILDPPFFSTTNKGIVDLENNNLRLINKVRPLINDNGWLITINNALYVNGHDYLKSLEILCMGGYLSIEELIPIPQDIAGFNAEIKNIYPTDPSPFNHPTKIAILKIRRKITQKGIVPLS